MILLRRMAEQGYDLAASIVSSSDGDTLIHRLIAAGGHDVDWLTEEQMSGAAIQVPSATYRTWFDALPAESSRDGVMQHWGAAPVSSTSPRTRSTWRRCSSAT